MTLETALARIEELEKRVTTLEYNKMFLVKTVDDLESRIQYIESVLVL